MVAARFAIQKISCKLIILSVGEATHAGTPLLALAARDDQFVVFRYCVHLLVEFVVCFVHTYCALHGWHSSTTRFFSCD